MIDTSKITDEDIKKYNEWKKDILSPHEGTWVHDIPFYLVPEEIVLGFRGNQFTIEEFYLSTQWQEPSHWNAGLVRDGRIVIFMYGQHNKLEKYLYVERIGAVRSAQSFGNGVWELSLKEGERFAREKGCTSVWTTTVRRGEVKKFMGVDKDAQLNPKSIMVLWKKLK